jgi:hypothetical protein
LATNALGMAIDSRTCTPEDEPPGEQHITGETLVRS